jgi:hypothetical protein
MEQATQQQAGWSPDAFSKSVGLTRSYLYTLPDDKRPESVKVGRRRIITEAPQDWLARIGEAA